MVETWVRVAAAADVAEGSAIGVRVGDREIALYHLPGGEFRATDNICSHEYAQLSDGWLENGEIECPLHAARFDIRSGKALCAPAEKDIAVFEVKREGADLLVKLAR
ncbi:MAG: non-heme iron oxygenase ferredoxin subunit [Rhodospirillales bacterium]|nr:non-heme iron oxygenase ferredoxin subunit [Rhodospirillales bacterium]